MITSPVVVCILILILGFKLMVQGQPLNYAEETIKPLETTLLKRGAIKNCSRGDDGRGSDNDVPHFYSIFEIPRNHDDAAKLAFAAAKENGFELVKTAPPPNPADNEFYADNTSKVSLYKDLEPGKIKLFVEIFGSEMYSEKESQFCGVQQPDVSRKDRTTIWVSVTLPPFKHH